MPASQPAHFNLQEFTDVGQLMVGGRLYTYAYGTTAQKIAYTDPDGTVPHTYTLDGAGGQYIALNARGELPAPLYLGDGSYDIALKRADGSTVWTRKAVGVENSVRSLTTDLAGGPGASLVGFLQPGIAAVKRTLLDKSQEVISALDFGADPTGVKPSSDAIQAAIVAARMKANNGQAVNQSAKTAVVHLPPGVYLIDKPILVSMNTTLRGDGATIACYGGGPTFDSAYYLNGVLTSNSGLSDGDLVNNVLSGVRFENLTFYGGDTSIRLRGCVWQSGVFNCSFYGVHIAVDTRFCFYSRYENLTIRDDNAGFAAAHALRFGSNSNRVEVSNISIVNRTRGILLGEPGDANISGQFSFNNSSIESTTYGFEIVGTVRNLHIHDIYFESVSSAIFDADGALKYDVNVHNCYSNSTAYFVDMSGLRDSFIGSVRDWSSQSSVKAAVRLRQDTNGNAATVEMSNLGDTTTGTNRYQLSNGVATLGTLSKYTNGISSVMLNQDFSHNLQVSQYANQPAVYDSGWYGEAPGYIIGAINGVLTPVNGTEPYIATQFWFSEYTALNYSIKITPNAGSGSDGTTPAPIFLKGIVIGSHATQIVSNSFVAFGFKNGASGTFNIGFGEFGTGAADSAFAWMRNGQFTAEGIIKLIA